jgi:hypothetical protein
VVNDLLVSKLFCRDAKLVIKLIYDKNCKKTFSDIAYSSIKT